MLTGSTALPSSEALTCSVGEIAGHRAVVAASDFASHGGTFGEAEADAFVTAVSAAVERSLPLVTILRSGGTRLHEGMAALVGIPRTTLALQRLHEAGLPHISVADHPTTGGVWVSMGATADIRLAVRGAIVGFSGPRAVKAMTGRELAHGANTAAAAYDAGLVDAVIEPDELATAVGNVLTTLRADEPADVTAPSHESPPPRAASEQVVASRTEPRPSGSALITELLAEPVPLRAADTTVTASVGRLGGRRVVAVALAAQRAAMPTAAGYQLLTRAARLADRLGLGLVCLVDTPGADPHEEAHGLAAAIADAMLAVLSVRSPTVCVVHGEGGSGGALAAAVTDVVGVGPHGWFAALGPEGAAATLRIEPAAAAELMRVCPAELLADGFADEFVTAGSKGAWLAACLDRLAGMDPDRRLERRRRRWAGALRRS